MQQVVRVEIVQVLAPLSAVLQKYVSFQLEHSVSPFDVERLVDLFEVVGHLKLVSHQCLGPVLYLVLDRLVALADFYLLVVPARMVDGDRKLTYPLSSRLSEHPSRGHSHARSIDVP